jgi:hypothetical protein
MMGTLVRIGRPILIFCSGFAMSNFHVGGLPPRWFRPQRQAATCTDARQTIGFNGSSGRRRNAAGDSGYNRRHPPPAWPPAAVPPARPSKKMPLIGNSAQRIKACRAVIGLGPMSQLGQSRHFGRRPTTSGLPPGNGHPQSRSACLKRAMSGSRGHSRQSIAT